MLSRSKTTNPDWTPRHLPGGIYCSPACAGARGFCTEAAYNHANKEAEKLAKRLGDGWKVEIWENLGWHYRVSKGCFEIHRDGDRYYAAFQSVKQFFADAETPEDAIGFATQDARTFIRRIEADLLQQHEQKM